MFNSNKKKLNNQRVKENQFSIILLVFPFISLFFIFTVLPVLSSMALSLFSWDLVSAPKFIGIENYLRMFFDDEIFPIVIKNTLFFAIIAGPAGFLMSFVLAWFVNEFEPRIRTFLSFLFYTPSLVGGGIFIWQVVFSSDSYGYINSALLSLNLIKEPILWLQDPERTMTIVIIVQLWQSMGVSFLANISGLQNINVEYFEAGAIDGIRNRWQELWYITLPTMKNMLLFSAVMQIQSSFAAGAISTQLCGYPSVDMSVDMLTEYMTDVGTVRYEMGYASSLAVILFLAMLIARHIIAKALNKIGK